MNLNNENIEKVKALELSNFIDKREGEFLSEGGYYTKLGEEAIFNPNKKKGGAQLELQNFEREINKKERELNLSPQGEELLGFIKTKKMEMIRKNLSAHEALQLEKWISQTIEEAIDLSVKKAVFHRESDEEILSIIQSGRMIIILKGKIFDYDVASTELELEQFENEVLSEILNSYEKEGNLRILEFYKNYKKKLNKENREKYEEISKNTEKLYRAKELSERIFSLYCEDKKGAFKKLEEEKGDEMAKNLLSGLFSSKEKREEEKENALLLTMFQEILKIRQEGASVTYDLIPYELKNKEEAKSYLEKLMRGEEIKTSDKDFLSLYERFSKNPYDFPKYNFIKFKMTLSDYDFTLFSKLSMTSSKITQSEGFDIARLIDEVVSGFEDKKKVEFIRYFLDDLISAFCDKNLDFEEKREIIQKRASELSGEKKGVFGELKDKVLKVINKEDKNGKTVDPSDYLP